MTSKSSSPVSAYAGPRNLSNQEVAHRQRSRPPILFRLPLHRPGAAGFLNLSQWRVRSPIVTAITGLRFSENRGGQFAVIGMCAEERGAGIVVLDEERHDHG